MAAASDTASPIDGLRVAQALNGGNCDPGHQRQQAQAVDQSRQEFGPPEAVAVPGRSRTAGQPGRHRRQRQRGGIVDHVAGVGDQRQRTRPPPYPGFHPGIGQGQRGGQPQEAARGFAGW